MDVCFQVIMIEMSINNVGRTSMNINVRIVRKIEIELNALIKNDDTNEMYFTCFFL